ncbi:UNVERIFIED_CONTAM: hypothetical protein LK11_23240 [Mumia flava]|uniref:alpha/beta hydrolase n=1 Tax=Mumia flava TaxID=1348852 RepID=UPI0005737989|nr:alpha/beta hydrolase [Mumia flava]
MRGRRLAVLAAATAILVAGCTSAQDARGGDDPTAAATSSAADVRTPPDPALAPYYEQQVDWRSCDGDECADVEVPLDYANPDGERIALRLRKHVAGRPDDRVGTLFVNPGGPGVSGVDYAAYFPRVAGEAVTDRFDVVGFDPRGVGASSALDCGDTAEVDAYVETDQTPDDASEEQALVEASQTLGEECERGSGALASHVSTVEAARDLDVLRAVVDDQALHYLGASYGTKLGATYAELFADRVGRMVLDGAMDPTLDSEGVNLGQAEGFQTALEAYVADCVETAGCPLGEDTDAGLEEIGDLIASLDDDPLPTSDPDRPLTEALGFYAVAYPLYNEASWPVLTEALADGLDGDGDTMLFVADQYLSRGSDGYTDNSTVAFPAISCLDDTGDVSLDEARESLAEFEDVSPVLGRSFAWSAVGCSTWPMEATEPAPEIDAAGAPPILVVGTTRDPATPYAWAEALADQLDSGVLVTRDGDGHTGYAAGNGCVDAAVDEYLVDGTVPEDGLEC